MLPAEEGPYCPFTQRSGPPAEQGNDSFSLSYVTVESKGCQAVLCHTDWLTEHCICCLCWKRSQIPFCINRNSSTGWTNTVSSADDGFRETGSLKAKNKSPLIWPVLVILCSCCIILRLFLWAHTCLTYSENINLRWQLCPRTSSVLILNFSFQRGEKTILSLHESFKAENEEQMLTETNRGGWKHVVQISQLFFPSLILRVILPLCPSRWPRRQQLARQMSV